MAKIGDKNDGMHNEYGYSDPTASAALKNLSHEERKLGKLLRIIFAACDLAGFELEGRIVLIDKKTGKRFD